MAVSKKLLRPLGITFFLIIGVTISLYLYAWIDSIVPFRYCPGYWIWAVIAAIVFLLFPNIFYTYMVVRYCKKPRISKVNTMATVKSSRTWDKSLKRIGLALFLILIFVLSTCLLILTIIVAVYHGTSTPNLSLPIEVNYQKLTDTLNVTRDAENTPHIQGVTSDDVFFGQGFVHAQERIFQLDFLRRIVQGKISTIVNSDDALRSDILMRTLGIYKNANDTYQNARKVFSNFTLNALESYSAGINQYMSTSPPTPFEFRNYNYWPTAWSPVDSIALLKLWQWSQSANIDKELSRFRLLVDRKLNVSRVLELEPYTNLDSFSTFTAQELGISIINIPYNIARHRATLASEESYLVQLQQKLNVTPIAGTVPTDNDGTKNLDAETPYDLMANWWDATAKTYGSLHQTFSSLWIAHTQQGTSNMQPMFANNLDHRLDIPCFFLPMHMKVEPAINPLTDKRYGPTTEIMGATIPGVPGMLVGRGLSFSWNMVPNMADTMDLFIVHETVPGSEYSIGNNSKSYDIRTEVIDRIGGTSVTITVANSDHGIIMTREAVKKGVGNNVLALKWAGLTDGYDTTLEVLTNVLQTTTYGDFRSLVTTNWVSPAANIFYADRNEVKNFMIVGRVPWRASGHSGLFPVEATPQFSYQGNVPIVTTTRLFKKPIIVSAGNRIVDIGYDFSYGFDFDDDFRATRINNYLNSIIANRAVIKDNLLTLQSDLVDTLFLEFKSTLIPLLKDSMLDSAAIAAKKSLLNWDGDTSDKSPVNGIVFRGFYWQLTRMVAQETKVRYWNVPRYFYNLFVNNTRLNDTACGGEDSCLTAATKAFQTAISTYGTDGWGYKYHSSPMRHLLTRDGEPYACFCSRYVNRQGNMHTLNAAPELMGPSNNFESVQGHAYRFIGYLSERSFDHKYSASSGFFDHMIPMGISGFQWTKEGYDFFLGRYLNNEYAIVDMKNFTGSRQQISKPVQ